MKRLFYYLTMLLACIMVCASPGFSMAKEKPVKISRIIVTGNSILSEEDLQPFLADSMGKELTLPELKSTASAITEAYRVKGYILTKAYVPEQKISAGEVEIAVVEGRIGAIRVQGHHKYYSTPFIESYLAPVANAPVFNQKSLERALLLLNEYPKLEVTARFEQGRETGTSDLLVTANNSLPLTISLDYNNYGSRYIGGLSRFGLEAAAGNLIKEGSNLTLKVVTGEKPEDLLYGRVAYTLPINVYGTKVGAFFSKGDYEVGRDFAVLDINGKATSYGILASHPFIKSRLLTLSGEVGFYANDAELYVLGDTLYSEDSVRAVQGGLRIDGTDPKGRTLATLNVSQGLGDTLGGMSDNDPMASRVNADNSFTKANLELARIQTLSPKFSLVLRGTGQLTSDNLVMSEQFSIGGANSVRGFDISEHTGDRGYTTTIELRATKRDNRNNVMVVSLFADHGSITRETPVAGQEKTESLTGVGVGINFLYDVGINLKAEIGFPVSPSKTAHGDSAVFYFQAQAKY